MSQWPDRIYIYIYFGKRFQRWNVFPISLVSIDTKFRKFTRSTHYHDDTARKHSIRRVEMTEIGEEGKGERKRLVKSDTQG